MRLGQQPTTFNPIGDSSTKLNSQIPVTLTQVNKDASDALGTGGGGCVTIEQVINIFNTYISNTNLSSLLDVDDLLGDAPDNSIFKKVSGEWTFADEYEYTLPIAGASTLGGVKIGSNISIDVNGVISVDPDYEYWIIQTGDESYSSILRHGVLTISCSNDITAVVEDGVLTIGSTFAELDPVFTAWDKSTGISITESQISDLQAYLTAETDPIFLSSAAAGITLSDIANWNSSTSYTHPTQSAISPTLTGASVLASLVVNTLGHVTAATSRTLTLADLGFSDSGLVHIAGTETITGQKSFTNVVDITTSNLQNSIQINNSKSSGYSSGAYINMSGLAYQTGLSISATNGNGIYVQGSSIGLYSLCSDFGISATASSGVGGQFQGTAYAIDNRLMLPDIDNVFPISKYSRFNSLDAGSISGNGVSEEFFLTNSVTVAKAGERRIIWTTSTAGNESSSFEWWLKDAGSDVAKVMSLNSVGDISVNGLSLSTSPSVPLHTEGHVYWDSTDHCLAVMSGISDTVLQVGQEVWVRVRNNTGATIANGKAVYITGRTGDRPNVALAIASSAATSKVLGITTQAIDSGDDGFVTISGLVRGVNLSSFAVNDPLYLSATTAGELVNSAPSSPNYVVPIGDVAVNTGAGSLSVNLGIEQTNHSTLNHLRVYGSLESVGSKFGSVSGGNYTEFESDGTIKFIGAATVWKDIDFPIVIRTTGTGIPSIATMFGTLTAPQWAVNDAAVCEGQEMVHEWKEGSDASMHIHVFTGGTDTSNRYLKFEVDYSWGNLNTTMASIVTVASGELLIPANTPANTHLLFPISTISIPTMKIGAHFKTRLKRVAAVGTAPTANPFCEMLQLHVECDTIGSRAMTAK